MHSYHNSALKLFLIICYLAFFGSCVFADNVRFTPSYNTYDGKSGGVNCSDSTHVCQDSGTEKIVQGVKVKKDCWRYAYSKTCQTYPSKNDCGNWRKCYLVADRECLTWDSYSNCVNIKKEYSCKDWDSKASTLLDKERTRWSPDDKNKARQLVCQGIPCVDGNCVDKSYEMNGEVMESTSKLYAAKESKEAKGNPGNANLFPGVTMHCNKKPTSYLNCCSAGTKELFNNWGQHIGAQCSKDEKLLLENRRKDLCVYAVKTGKGNLLGSSGGVIKHYYCCWGNLLNKVIQEEGRKQLGRKFHIGDKPDCSGFTLDDLKRLDFEKMDLSKAYADLVRKMKLPDISDIDSRIKDALPNIREGDDNEFNQENKKSGINSQTQGILSDDSPY